MKKYPKNINTVDGYFFGGLDPLADKDKELRPPPIIEDKQ